MIVARKIDLDCGTVEYRDLVDPGGVIYTQVHVGCNSLGTCILPSYPTIFRFSLQYVGSEIYGVLVAMYCGCIYVGYIFS